MPASDFDSFLLTYRPDLQVIFLRWSRVVSSLEHRAGYEAALALATPHGAGRWLIDLRNRGLASSEDFAWVLAYFRPQMAAALPAPPRRLAYLVTPNYAAVIQERLALLEPTYSLAVQQSAAVGVFTEERLAQQWLQQGTN